MSKDFILNYAKGEASNPAYLIVFSIGQEGIVIHSCVVISGQTESILIKKIYEEQSIDVSEKEVIEAAEKYMMQTHPANY
jgi:hypothetical protein